MQQEKRMRGRPRLVANELSTPLSLRVPNSVFDLVCSLSRLLRIKTSDAFRHLQALEKEMARVEAVDAQERFLQCRGSTYPPIRIPNQPALIAAALRQLAVGGCIPSDLVFDERSIGEDYVTSIHVQSGGQWLVMRNPVRPPRQPEEQQDWRRR